MEEGETSSLTVCSFRWRHLSPVMLPRAAMAHPVICGRVTKESGISAHNAVTRQCRREGGQGDLAAVDSEGLQGLEIGGDDVEAHAGDDVCGRAWHPRAVGGGETSHSPASRKARDFSMREAAELR